MIVRWLVFLVSLVLVSAAWASPRLFVFDCGVLNLSDADIAQFNLSTEETPVRDLFVPCYLIEHQGKRYF